MSIHVQSECSEVQSQSSWWFNNSVGKISAQPHTIVKQICFLNGNVLFLSLFSLSKNWMHNVVWGCAEILTLCLKVFWWLWTEGLLSLMFVRSCERDWFILLKCSKFLPRSLLNLGEVAPVSPQKDFEFLSTNDLGSCDLRKTTAGVFFNNFTPLKTIFCFFYSAHTKKTVTTQREKQKIYANLKKRFE